ncbi:DUF6503 family protein [Flavobacteriaceae bacterium]|nr:DUF6503 family protein [Flavobacteriaceae bacterium]
MKYITYFNTLVLKKAVYLVAFILSFSTLQGQDFTANELLNRSITYHDPDGLWKNFNGSFNVSMESPNRPFRKSKIELNFKDSFFRLTVDSDVNTSVYQLEDKECLLSYNGASDFSDEIADKNRLSCESAKMYRDYYTYLYGLPMKLKDSGTILNPLVEEKVVDNVSYWKLKVTYEPETVGDTWYFYFDKNSFQLKRYQFFHDESKNDGEYIVLKNELNVNGIFMPKDRSWYYNKDDKYLGTDYLSL